MSGLPEEFVVLIVEDGNEYLEVLTRCVPGPHYLQAHDGEVALSHLAGGGIDLLFLDMKFDRIPLDRLMGDYAQAVRQHNGNENRAWKHLQDNQGLYILDAVRRAGFGGMPALISYDFSSEPGRFIHLRKLWPRLFWIPEGATPADIVRLMQEAVAQG